MAFMMPVVKNDWDIYNSQRTRRSSESAPEARGRARKISESRSEGPAAAAAPRSGGLGASHRSAPTMRSASYSRVPSRASRSSLRPSLPDSPCKTASGSPPQQASGDKFHNRVRLARLPSLPERPERGLRSAGSAPPRPAPCLADNSAGRPA